MFYIVDRLSAVYKCDVGRAGISDDLYPMCFEYMTWDSPKFTAS